MTDTATEEKTDQTEKTEEKTNELDTEEEISEETIESAKEIASVLEDDDETEEDEQTEADDKGDDDKKIEGDETESKETSEKAEDDDKTKADDNSGQTEQKDAEIDDSLLQRAVGVGMSIVQARAFGSKEALEQSVVFSESQIASKASVESNSDAKAAEKKQDEEEVKVEKVTFDHLLEAGYDKDLVDTLNKTVGGLTDKIEQLTKDGKARAEENAQLRSSVDDRETDRAINDFDERIGKLPDEFKEVFGEGNFDSLTKNSKEYGQRSKVLSEMGAMSAGYTASKQVMPQIQTLLERAIFNVTGKIVTAKQTEKKLDEKDQKIKDDLAKRAKSIVGKPNGGKVKDQTNAGKTLQAANKVSRILDGKI